MTDISRRLASTKALRWTGEAELPQLAWPNPCDRLLLVVDLWSGTGGLLVACLALGLRVIAVSIEQDLHLRQATAKVFPNLIHMDKVEDMKGQLLLEVIEKRKPVGI